jgi:ribonuclease HI
MSKAEPRIDKKTDHEEGIVVYFDGLCEPVNPGGIATYGVVIRKGSQILFEENGLAEAEPWSDDASNNVAEYSALIRGLRWLKENGYSSSNVLVKGDSRLVVNQLRGDFKVKAPRIVTLFHQAKELISSFKNFQIQWIERSENSEADLQSRIAYSKFRKIYPQK